MRTPLPSSIENLVGAASQSETGQEPGSPDRGETGPRSPVSDRRADGDDACACLDSWTGLARTLSRLGIGQPQLPVGGLQARPPPVTVATHRGGDAMDARWEHPCAPRPCRNVTGAGRLGGPGLRACRLRDVSGVCVPRLARGRGHGRLHRLLSGSAFRLVGLAHCTIVVCSGRAALVGDDGLRRDGLVLPMSLAGRCRRSTRGDERVGTLSTQCRGSPDPV